MMVGLYSARTKDGFEAYSEHIERCLERFEKIFPVFYSSIIRIFEYHGEKEELKSSFEKMVMFHDLGKLTTKWQKCLIDGKKNPIHAPIGAAYLWKTLPENLKNPLAFAVCIHHTDQGLLGDNIEKPDVRAILDGIAGWNGKIIWDEKIREEGDFIPKDLEGKVDVTSLKEMAVGLREWSRGCSILEQHRRRLMASLAHHILKLCDISAALERAEYEKTDDVYGGWRMVAEIEKYVLCLEKRVR